MSGAVTNMDVRLLARWLGAAGARAGLLASRQCTIATLVGVARSLGIEVKRGATRRELIDDLVRAASKRIDKPLDDLFEMERDDLVRYFDEREVEAAELIDLLKELDLSPDRTDRKNLIYFAARELSETGRFRRIARNQHRVTAEGSRLSQSRSRKSTPTDSVSPLAPASSASS